MDGNNQGKNQFFFSYRRNTFFPSILDLPFSNLTNINIFFMLLIHICTFKIRIGYNPHICWFATNPGGQMEETKVDFLGGKGGFSGAP